MPTHVSPIAPATTLQLALQKCRGAFYYAAFFSLCINLLTVLFSLYSLQVLDRVFSSRSLETLLMLTLLMVVAVVFYGLFSAVRSLILSRTGAWLEQALAPELLLRSLCSSASSGPVSASQQQRDLGNIGQFISGNSIIAFFDAPWSVIYLLVTLAISPALGWIACVGCILLTGLAVLTELITRKPLGQAQRANLESVSYIDASSRQAETVEAMGMTHTMVERWRLVHDRAQELQRLAGHRSALVQSVTRVTRMALQIAITGGGACLVLANDLTPGGMIAASLLGARAFAPFENAISVWKQTVATRDAYKRLNASMAMPVAARGQMALPVPRGEITVEKLGFQPQGMPKPVVSQVAFTLQPGESLGVIGPSGAGKSTLLRLLIGNLPPTQGHVRMDGNDMATWNRDDLGQHVGYLPQHADLFAGTIAENIARMQPDATSQSVIDAAQLAGVHKLIQRLPLGYDTVWRPGHALLSPGQKQRIALARAVYGKPSLIILDEPNLHMDGEGEAVFPVLLRHLKLQRVTVVIAAHKPSIISCLDKILVLQQGRMEKFGRRDEILSSCIQPLKVQAQS
jgi:ATP-binding cassette, subfamily B, bacterial